MGEIFYFYYENSNGDKVIINSRTKEIKTYGYEEYKMFNKSKTIYHMMKGFDANEEGLNKYVNDFKEWATELKNNKVLNIDIFRYYNLYIAVEMTFKRLCKGKYESHDKITEKERQWQEKCYNGALTYCDDSAIDLITECFTYDYSSQYPKILASNSFFIPTKEGKEYKLKKLPDMKGMQTGYYHAKITCNNIEFKKLFSFSEDDVYTDRSLYQAMKHQKEFNVKIELVTDVEYNSYLYDDDCLVSGSKIFGGWFKKLSELKKLFPKNPIIKFMSSAIWGFICKKTPIYKSEQEITNENLDVGVGKNTKRRYRIIKQYFNHGTPGKYELSDRQQGQKYFYRTHYTIFSMLSMNWRNAPDFCNNA